MIYLTIEAIVIFLIVGCVSVSVSGCSVLEIIEVVVVVEVELMVPTKGWSPLVLSVGYHAPALHMKAE